MKHIIKRTAAVSLFLYSSIILFSQKYSVPVSFELSHFRFEKTDSFTSIQCLENKEIKYPMPAGYPALPYISFYVLVPHNSVITGISTAEDNFHPVEGKYNIVRNTLDESACDSGPAQMLYAGYLINRIFLCPFRYNEKAQQLLFCGRMVITIHYKTVDKPIAYETSPEKIRQSREFIREIVINPGLVNTILPLEEKIDYSRIPVFRESGGNLPDRKKTVPGNATEKSAQPFYIKHIKTE